MGNTIKESFDSYPKVTKLIPKPIQNIITTGEKSGMLTDTLIKIGEAYEKKVETSIKDISTIIEPVLLIVIGCAVAIIALATLLPIYNLTTIL